MKIHRTFAVCAACSLAMLAGVFVFPVVEKRHVAPAPAHAVDVELMRQRNIVKDVQEQIYEKTKLLQVLAVVAEVTDTSRLERYQRHVGVEVAELKGLRATSQKTIINLRNEFYGCIAGRKPGN